MLLFPLRAGCYFRSGNENEATFNLGGYGDNTAAEYEAFVQKLKDGGLDKYMEEWNKQRTEFLEANA